MKRTRDTASFSVARSIAGVAVVTAALSAAIGGLELTGRSVAFAQAPVSDSTFSELVAFVEKRGWTVDLGRLCTALKLGPAETECKFKQVAVAEEGGTLANHGFNLALSATQPLPYIVLYHLRPLVGTFFVVTSGGVLKAAFYRAQGADYTALPDDDAKQAFLTEVEFWKKNLSTLEEMAKAGGIKR